jgi:hypothetical protein
LVIDRNEEIDSFLNFAKMAQENNNLHLSSRILQHLREDLIKTQ